MITYVPTEWDVLLERVMASLDDNGRESLERRRENARRHVSSRRIDPGKVDTDKVKRFLLLYSKLDKRCGKCMEESGVSKLELYDAYRLWPEFQFVRDYISSARHWAREFENEDMLEEARAGIRRLNTVEGCELNAKTLIHVNENLDRKSFGSKKDGGQGGRSGVTYIIPNLTVNNIMAPDEIAERVKTEARRAALAQGRVVEAEAVSIGS